MSVEAAHSELKAFLNNTKASEVEVPHDKVVEVTVDMTPTEAAKVLWNSKVIGAPVWDEGNKKYLGFFDMRDLLSTVIASHKEEEAKNTGPEYMFTKWFLKETKSKSGFTGM